MAKINERPNPIKITDPDTNEVYTLDFDREAVKFAERRGFKILEFQSVPETGVSDLFFYAFRKNHKNVARDKTDKILEDLGGLLPEEVNRLQELYSASVSSINVEGTRKNSKMRVEL